MNSNTILDFINTNFYDLLNQAEISTEICYVNNIKSDKYVDYLYNLNPSESGIFNKLRLRFFSGEKILSKQVPCNATFYSTDKIPALIIEKLFETIIGKFGVDSCNRSELDQFDREDIVTGTFFSGRFYMFNNFNSKYEEGEENLYSLLIGISEENGLELTILELQNILYFVEKNTISNPHYP